jgi:DNA polymerase-3 subunit epsilon
MHPLAPAVDIPVVALDLETTGTDVATDKIVQLSLARCSPGEPIETFTTYVNPGMPIPAQAAAVHHITDEMVAQAPSFRDIAQPLTAFIGDAALTGYGVAQFDIPLLERELEGAGIDLDLSGRPVIDVKVLYHRLRPRRLSDAYRDYCGGELADAHDAAQDARASLDVLGAMLAHHHDLPRSVRDLAASLRDPTRVDPQGKLVWVNDEAVFAFSKHKGKTLKAVAKTEPDFLRWMLTRDFSPAVRRIVRRALQGEFPAPPGTASGRGNDTTGK